MDLFPKITLGCSAGHSMRRGQAGLSLCGARTVTSRGTRLNSLRMIAPAPGAQSQLSPQNCGKQLGSVGSGSSHGVLTLQLHPSPVPSTCTSTGFQIFLWHSSVPGVPQGSSFLQQPAPHPHRARPGGSASTQTWKTFPAHHRGQGQEDMDAG